MCVPKLYAPIQTCVLRVVNNDTGEEIPRVFQKVAPYVYKRNKVRVAGVNFAVRGVWLPRVVDKTHFSQKLDLKTAQVPPL